MVNKLIVNIRQFIFGLQDSFPLVGRPLVIAWRLLDNLKFTIQKNVLQVKARFRAGDNQFKKELIIFFEREKAYQPITQDIPSLRQGDSRFEIIKKNLSVSGGTLLDIGANLGYFCHKFEDEGFDCYALEENRMLCYFMEKLKKAENRKFKVIPQSIFEYNKNKELIFDVVLALSVFHNFLERKDLYFNLIKLLKRLKTKELFFETYLPNEFKPEAYYKNYTPDQFVNFIIQNSCFNKAKFIGASEEGRPLYKLTP